MWDTRGMRWDMRDMGHRISDMADREDGYVGYGI